MAIALGCALSAEAAEPFALARQGQALAPIVVGDQPCASSTNMAATLREMLARITGASFVVTNGDGTTGLAVGLAAEFPALAAEPVLKLTERFGLTDLATRQSYILRSHDKGVQLIGASELGVAYAVWDFLHRLGYRQFFPGPVWEVVPRRPDPVVELDVFEKPDYIQRHIAGSVTPDWCLKNRASPVLGWQNAGDLPYLPRRWTGPLVQNQHNWGAIVGFAEEEFKAHPEYLGLPAKSLVSNLPYLRKQIPYYRAKHVRFFTGQATAGAWGGHGLGYYVLGRLLWQTNEAQRVEAIVDDFLARAFGDAAEPMREYWQVVDGSQQKPGSHAFFLDRANRMYVALREARSATADPAVRQRIDQLVLYARYVELFARHGQARGPDKWPALCRFVRHAYRMREANMVGYGVVLGYVPGAKTVELRPLLRPTAEEQALMEPGTRDNRVDAPFTEAEIEAMLDGSCRDPMPEEEAPAPAELLDRM
jgi:hypothetical protein